MPGSFLRAIAVIALLCLLPALPAANATSCAVATSATPTLYGTTVTFTATVTSAFGTPSGGTVTFFDGATSLGSKILGAAGTAAFATALLNVGAHSITASYGGNATWAASASSAITQTINKAGLTVKPVNASRNYGSANPTFTATYAGFKNGDTFATSNITGAPVFSTVATTSSTANSYPITTTIGTLSSPNYAFAPASGTLTVAKAPLTVTANNAWMSLGGPLPAFSASYSGFVLTDGPGSLGGTLSFVTSATASSPAGFYTVTPAGLSSANYSFTYVAGQLAVTSASATATPLIDTATMGDWTFSYGADGAWLMNDVQPALAYGSISPGTASQITWAAATSDTRALDCLSGPSTRRAASRYSFSSMSCDVTVSGTHRFALYFLDWEKAQRVELVEIIDSITGLVLSSTTLTDFGMGKYLVYDVSGSFTVRVSTLSSTNAVISGMFFGAPQRATNASAASYVGSDATTQGDWTLAYGADGYALLPSLTSLGSYGSLYERGSAFTWAASSSDVRALEQLPSGRTAACQQSASPFVIGVNVTGGTRRVAFYCVDWEKSGRSEQVDILDASTEAVLNTQTLSSFQNGKYLVYDLTGSVKVRFTGTAGPNAVVSGVFFGSARVPAVPGTAIFAGADITTLGNWTALYGIDGYDIPNAAVSYPAYAKVVERGNLYTWAASTTDVRGTELIGGGRTARGWYSSTSFMHSINVGSSPHTVAFYFVDWDRAGRAETVDILDGVSGAVLDTRSLSNFGGGQYLVYTVSGYIQVRVTKTAGGNGVMNGIFFGGIAPSGG
jgi:hypothetical protein